MIQYGIDGKPDTGAKTAAPSFWRIFRKHDSILGVKLERPIAPKELYRVAITNSSQSRTIHGVRADLVDIQPLRNDWIEGRETQLRFSNDTFWDPIIREVTMAPGDTVFVNLIDEGHNTTRWNAYDYRLHLRLPRGPALLSPDRYTLTVRVSGNNVDSRDLVLRIGPDPRCRGICSLAIE